MDNIAGKPHQARETDALRETIAILDLYDPWRTLNPMEKQHTWSRSNPFTARTLDYIFCGARTLANTKDTKIETFPHSDHKIVHTTIKTYRRTVHFNFCLLYTSPSPRDILVSRMPSSA